MLRRLFLSACLLCFGAVEAFAQQSYAAQEKPIRPPRIPVRPTRPGDIRVANIKPDLVVKEMRLEGDKAVHVLVANNGTADAGRFNVAFKVYGDEPDPKVTKRETLYELKAGEEKWLTFKSPFKYVNMSNPLVDTREFRLADMRSFNVYVDVHYSNSADPGINAMQDTFKDQTASKGDVVESDEGNNSMRVQKSDMAPWPPK